MNRTSARSTGPAFRRCVVHAIATLVLLGTLGRPVSAQVPSAREGIAGRVVKEGDAVEAIAVVLHRVTSDSAGVVATQTTAADGSFTFRRPAADSAGFTVLFTTADYQGIRYFGPAIHPEEVTEDYTIEVFDTAVVASPSPRIRVAQRDLVVFAGTDGSWEVNEIVEVENPERVTLVSPAGIATGDLRIPASAVAFEVADGQLRAQEVRRMDDQVLILAPLRPGVTELLMRYRVPAGEEGITLALDRPVDRMNLLIGQPSPRVTVTGLARRDTVRGERGETFLRFSGSELRAGSEVSAVWAEVLAAPVEPLHAAVVVVLAVLGCGAWVAIRGRQRPAACM